MKVWNALGLGLLKLGFAQEEYVPCMCPGVYCGDGDLEAVLIPGTQDNCCKGDYECRPKCADGTERCTLMGVATGTNCVLSDCFSSVAQAVEATEEAPPSAPVRGMMPMGDPSCVFEDVVLEDWTAMPEDTSGERAAACVGVLTPYQVYTHPLHYYTAGFECCPVVMEPEPEPEPKKEDQCILTTVRIPKKWCAGKRAKAWYLNKRCKSACKTAIPDDVVTFASRKACIKQMKSCKAKNMKAKGKGKGKAKGKGKGKRRDKTAQMQKKKKDVKKNMPMQ